MKAGLIYLIMGLLPVFAIADDGDAPKNQPAKFKIATKGKDDSVNVREGKSKVVLIIKSPFGISQAVIERQGEKWPNLLVLRLHLKGLESFRASNATVRLDAAVSSREAR